MNVSKNSGLPREASEVLDFWFGTLKPEQWWKRDEKVDAQITAKFAALYERLAQGVPGDWLATPRGRLAAVIVLDQFPRNMFRDDARAYDTDKQALALSSETIESGDDMHLNPDERSFLYMPFQHSEDRDVQVRSVELFRALGQEEQHDFAIKHKDIIDRFGRFPHRNAVLGRASTAEETEFLKKPGLFW